jgi:FkbM family methyltransferase
MKRFIQRSFRRFGIEIRRTRTAWHPGEDRDLLDFIADRGIDTVLDVGANVGQFGELLRTKGYRGKIVSFEPISSEHRTLAAIAAADGNWQTNNFALGAKAGSATINVADVSVFSSILPSTIAAANYDCNVAVSRTEIIDVRTLDEVCPDLPGNVLLKIDTQGYERQVLEGARHTLPGFKGVLLELPIVHLYEGTWQFHEAIAFMAEAGFIPAQIHPVNYHSVDPVSLIEVDCLFRPRDRRLD